MARCALRPTRAPNIKAAVSEPGSIGLADFSNRALRLVQHAIIADDGNTLRKRRLDATLANPALKCLESSQARNSAGTVRRVGRDKMNEAVVVQPQRQIANALGPGGFQLLEYRRNQRGVLFGHIGPGFVPDQGPFHWFAPWRVLQLGSSHLVWLRRSTRSEGFGEKDIFWTVSRALSHSKRRFNAQNAEISASTIGFRNRP